jgi:hypothetical protein
MEFLDHLQWPAMAVTLAASWLVASQQKKRRQWGFWLFLVSNVLWVVWGLHDDAYALILLQVGLAALNIRGAFKNEPAPQSDGKSPADPTGRSRAMTG